MRLSWLLLGMTCAGCDAPTLPADGETRSASAAAEAVAPPASGEGAGVATGTDVAAASGVAAAAANAFARPEFESTESPGGLFTAAWRPVGGDVPVNELFELEVLLFEGRGKEKPLAGAQVQVSAWMPEHMHGMSRRPQTTETAPGRYLVQGMMLHMEGFWQLFVDVVAGGRSERAEFKLELKDSAPLAVEGFTPDEVRAFLKLSPLPEPPPDPTNRFADDPRAARLGQFVFFDQGFSDSGTVSCATCHQPALGFADGKHFGDAGREEDEERSKVLDRHTPSLFNAAYHRWWFWDGRSDSLWAQALTPLEEPREHATTRLEIAHRLGSDPGLKRAYEETFGPLPELADAARFPPKGRPGVAEFDAMAAEDQLAVNRVFANVGKALAAYERRLLSRHTPFDEFVAGVRSSNLVQQQPLSPTAREGLRLFVGKARCILCHSGPTFSDREFHDNRVPTLSGEPRRDAGRHRGIPAVRADPFNGTGAFSDAPEGVSQDKLRFLPLHRDSWSEFKTPSLRNVSLTAPYMHQGQFATLDEVLAYYNTLERAVPTHSPERTLAPLNLPPESLAALREFLLSLTDARLEPALLEQPSTPYLE